MSLLTPSTTISSASSSSTSSVASLVQVVTITVVALTTTFTPPPSCTEMRLTQLSSPGYEIWLNEPNPVPKSKFGDCYPSQFIQGYTSIANASSSIAPMFSPLVCPSGWKTAKEWENGYIACCASGFLFHPPDTTVDTDRPGYGGTCYSNFVGGQTVNVTAYDSASVTATAEWVASASTDQAYAHPIDGIRLDVDAPASAQLSGGAIAGITIGAIAVLFIAVLLFWLHRRKRKAAMERDQYKDVSLQNAAGSPTGHSAYAGSTVAGTQSDQKELPTPLESPHQAPDTQLYELDGFLPRELDGGYRGMEMRG